MRRYTWLLVTKFVVSFAGASSANASS